jgi:hypothetical protein
MLDTPQRAALWGISLDVVILNGHATLLNAFGSTAMNRCPRRTCFSTHAAYRGTVMG